MHYLLPNLSVSTHDQEKRERDMTRFIMKSITKVRGRRRIKEKKRKKEGKGRKLRKKCSKIGYFKVKK
jgi:hypothetical protein